MGFCQDAYKKAIQEAGYKTIQRFLVKKFEQSGVLLSPEEEEMFLKNLKSENYAFSVHENAQDQTMQITIQDEDWDALRDQLDNMIRKTTSSELLNEL